MDTISIHYDCDGVLRDFHERAFKVFFSKHPEFKKYILPVEKYRGWSFSDQLKKGPDTELIEKLMWEELFENEEMCFESFGKASPLVSPEEWNVHLDKIRSEFPNAIITISTHQYTDIARDATLFWLKKNGFTDKDNINILFTGKKDLFGAHFLLDDKPAMIEKFHKPYESIGVLFLCERTNGWYVKENKGKLKIPFAKTLDDYYKIISKKAIELL